MNRMSERLKTVCEMVHGDGTLADIGCDHAYVPIALIRSGQFSRAIAADVRPGPLAIAGENIRQQGLADRIHTRLSDGLQAFRPGEADTVVIAGMGGPLICSILKAEPAVTGSIRELVLEPQSDVGAVRRMLAETSFAGQRFRIASEELVQEDGKYYPVIRAVSVTTDAGDSGPDTLGSVPAEPDDDRELAYRFGALLLNRRHPVLCSYLLQQQAQAEKVLAQLQNRPETQKTVLRMEELREELRLTEKALGLFFENDGL